MNKDRHGNKTTANELSRREFLALSQQVLFSASMVSVLPMSVTASDVAALDLRHLDPSEGLILSGLARLLFPHHSLPDTVYLDVVREIETDMEASDKTRALITGIKAKLDSQVQGDWLSTSITRQVEVLKSMQGSELFNYLHNRTIESLYRHPTVWKLIGYQGSSVEYGGYLHRGFDDIDWLDK